MVKTNNILASAALFIAAFVSSAVGEVQLKHLHVKFALWDGFYKMPVSVHQIKKRSKPEFVNMGRDEELNVDLYSYPKDPRFSLLFDTHGHIAGIRLGFIKADVANKAKSKGVEFLYSYDKNPMCSSGRYWDTDVWYTSVLFVSPEKLKAGGRSETKGLVAEDIYLKLEGKWTKISKYEKDAVSQQFIKQGCFFGMGQHYFYKVSPDVKCGTVQGAFLLFERGKLNGLGFHMFGSFTPGPDRIWLEDPPVSIVKTIVNNGPDCIPEWVDNFGVITFHIFFKRFPRLTFCIWPFQ